MLSIGQVVPHEVMGMANYNKNVFVGARRHAGHQRKPFHRRSLRHGTDDGPGRHSAPPHLELCSGPFLHKLPLVYVLTVIGPRDDGSLAVRGLFIGGDVECFHAASELS